MKSIHFRIGSCGVAVTLVFLRPFLSSLLYDYIKHNTIIAFPSVIFVKDLSKGIPYTITSKNLPEVVSGEIKVTDDVQNQ